MAPSSSGPPGCTRPQSAFNHHEQPSEQDCGRDHGVVHSLTIAIERVAPERQQVIAILRLSFLLASASIPMMAC